MTRVVSTHDFEGYGVIVLHSPKKYPKRPYLVIWTHRATAAQHAEQFRTEREANRRIDYIHKTGGWRWPLKTADWL